MESDRLKMQTPNGVDENIEKIQKLFPDCVTERKNEKGEVETVIDFDVLRQELSKDIVEGREERYQFTWPDKKKAVFLSNAPTTATLRPCREESVDFDNTQNLYIEGDNLEVLKCLKETYMGKVKMIYIDPPYNTGNDFVYNDNFTQDSDEYKANSGQYDEDGNRLVQNNESNGRFHTDWLNMIYPRLKVARDLLTEDGVIFISIDDNEVHNLRKVCDEIFGEINFVAQIIWERAYAPINLMKHFSRSHDYILCYAKNINDTICNGIGRSEEADSRYNNPDNDPRGVWKPSDLSVGPRIEEKTYKITTPSGRVVEPPAGRCWRLSRNAFLERLNDKRIWFGPEGDSVPSLKRFRSELRKDGITPMTIWKYTEVEHSQDATKKLKDLFDGKMYFDYPKPVPLVKRCLELYTNKDSLVLDFFSGSATTAHAVMKLNAEDKGHRKFIMVQLPEKTDEKSEAYKAGYKNICEIGKERIRRANKNVMEEIKAKNDGLFGDKNYKLDIGFRDLKLDSSSMEDIYYAPSDVKQDDLFAFADNIKPDRTGEDLLFQVMLDLGILLDNKIEETEIGGKKVYSVADGFLIACFDKDVNDEVVTAIAKQKPTYAVFRDSGMESDSTATNFEQIFATYSPDTTRKIL